MIFIAPSMKSKFFVRLNKLYFNLKIGNVRLFQVLLNHWMNSELALWNEQTIQRTFNGRNVSFPSPWRPPGKRCNSLISLSFHHAALSSHVRSINSFNSLGPSHFSRTRRPAARPLVRFSLEHRNKTKKKNKEQKAKSKTKLCNEKTRQRNDYSRPQRPRKSTNNKRARVDSREQKKTWII